MPDAVPDASPYTYYKYWMHCARFGIEREHLRCITVRISVSTMQLYTVEFSLILFVGLLWNKCPKVSICLPAWPSASCLSYSPSIREAVNSWNEFFETVSKRFTTMRTAAAAWQLQKAAAAASAPENGRMRMRSSLSNSNHRHPTDTLYGVYK